MDLRINKMCFIKNCQFCQKKAKSLKILMVFLLVFFISITGQKNVFAVGGQSQFYEMFPKCYVNTTSISNCSQQDILLTCENPNPQFLLLSTFTFNSTPYISETSLPNLTHKTLTLREQYNTTNEIYTWNNVVIIDTNSNIGIFLQNITVSKSCPDCFENIVQINSTCQTDDTKFITYNDTSQCSETILPPNSTVFCDFCTPDWQCDTYSPALCGIHTSYRDCTSVYDKNNCLIQTGLQSDNFTGNLDDFMSMCSVADFKYNATLYSSLTPTLYVYPEYPYYEANTTLSMEVIVKLANTKVLVDNVQINIANTTIVFTQNNATKTYTKSFIISEYGDFPFVITGRDNGLRVFAIDGIIYSRRFLDVSVEIYEDKALDDRYENDLAHVVAFKNDENFKAEPIGETGIQIANQLNNFNLWVFKLAKLNTTTYYTYNFGKRAFHDEYIDGVAHLRLPYEENASFELRLLNSEKTDEYIFDDYNYASISTYDVTASKSVFLTNGKITHNLAVKIYSSPYDLRYWDMMKKWVILIAFILVVGIAGFFVYHQTQDISLVIKLAVALISALPILYLLLSWLYG